jgi:hypothetical protein
MDNVLVEWTRDVWVISTDRSRLDPTAILALLTRDAETLYRKAGFEAAAAPLVYLERRSTRAGRPS